MFDSLHISNLLRKSVNLAYSKISDDVLCVTVPRFDSETGREIDSEKHIFNIQMIVDKKTQVEREIVACETLINQAVKLGFEIPNSGI